MAIQFESLLAILFKLNSMKVTKALLLFLLLPLLSYSKSNEFCLSYSPLSVYKLGHTVEDGLTETNHSVIGAFTLDYYRYLNKPRFKVSSSLSMGYAFSKQTSTEGLNLNLGTNGFTGHLGLGYKGFLGIGYFVRV